VAISNPNSFSRSETDVNPEIKNEEKKTLL
jgi:hypothetical protein